MKTRLYDSSLPVRKSLGEWIGDVILGGMAFLFAVLVGVALAGGALQDAGEILACVAGVRDCRGLK